MFEDAIKEEAAKVSMQAKHLAAIIETIKAKCRRRNIIGKSGEEADRLYTEICAMEDRYVYRFSRYLTDMELEILEDYMTDSALSNNSPKLLTEYKRVIIKLARHIKNDGDK